MSHQAFITEPRASMYEQLMSVKDVTEVYWYEDMGNAQACGFYVKGGSDESIAEAMSLHTYTWNMHMFKGDTFYEKEFFTAAFYRDYNIFIIDAHSYGIFL